MDSSSDHDDGGWEGASESTEATASCSSTSLRPAASRGSASVHVSGAQTGSVTV